MSVLIVKNELLRCGEDRHEMRLPQQLVRVARILFTNMLWGAVIWIALLSSSMKLLSQEGCEQTDILGNSLVRLEDRLGEFRFKLNPPDYASAFSVQNHLAFSTVL